MRKQKRWIGVTAITGVTVIALVASIMIKKHLSGDAKDVISITEEGTSLGIKGIEVLTNKDGSVSGYKVNVETKGFGADPIVMAVSFNASADEVTGVEVVSQNETDGLGSKITEETFLSQFVGLKLPAYLEGMTSGSSEEGKKDVISEETTSKDVKHLVDGTYEVIANEAHNGWTSQVSLTVSGGVITEVVWDAVDADGNKKSVQSLNGEYVMTEEGPTWAAQAEALAAYVIENQTVNNLSLNQEGKTDAVASVSITVTEFVEQVKECLVLASGDKVVEAALKDGTYEVVAKEAHNGWTSQVSLSVKSGAITDVIWDSFDADGNKKSVQSTNGEYVMTENGPTWAEQANALAAYVIENQSINALVLDENGKTDTIASVSITISEFVAQVQECLELAAGVKVVEASLQDGTYQVVAAEAHNGWTSQVSITVAGGAVTDVVWESVDADGNKKSVQSENGEYVMTENGPTWSAQAKALAAYVIENQTASTISLDENGKTDTVASVSITVDEFVAQVQECLQLAASAKSPEKLTLVDGTYEAIAGEASNGWTSQVSITVAGGVITEVVFESLDASGNKKSVQSENGEYVMTENGPTWSDQAKALAAFVIDKQGLSELTVNGEGKTDVVASVSITVTDFVDLVETCLLKAASTEAISANDIAEKEEKKETEIIETNIEGTKVDAISGATISTKAVITGINNAFEYLQRTVVK